MCGGRFGESGGNTYRSHRKAAKKIVKAKKRDKHKLFLNKKIYLRNQCVHNDGTLKCVIDIGKDGEIKIWIHPYN